ncbi:MAG: Kelch repeat-containing protein, partial [Blastocatellia bacterium]
DFLNDRGAHTATVMANARVLIVGGAADGGGASPLPSVEIHDPAGGKWSVEKPLSRARVDHTATLLPNGKVLVAGGIDKNGSMKSAELYTSDLSNNVGTWSPTADMNVARQEHRATLLANGKVLVTGGVSGGAILDSAEIYDPITGAWTLIDPMPGARVTHTATLLANGKVLITGGRNGFGVIRSCAIYDPATNSWGGAGSLNQPRANHTATLLYDGRVLAAGGSPTTSLATSELYDVAANRWANVASQMLPAGHRNHTATLLPNGKVLLVAGLRGSGNEITDFNGSAHLFDTARLRWDSVTAPTGRLGHTATLLPNGKALIVGGFTIQSAGGGGLTTVIGNSVQFYDPARGVSVPYTTGPSMSAPRDGHTATLLANGKVLVTGGVRRSAVLGQTFIEFLSSVETFDAGLGVDELAATVSPFVTSATWNGPGNPLCAAGIRFQGVSESGGGGPLSSNPNYPVLQLMRIDNEQQYFLSPDPGSTRCATRGWTNNGYGSMTIPATTSLGATNNMQPGPVMLTAFVNGTPNRRSLILGVSGAQNETVNLSGRIHTVADSGLQVAVELRGSDGSMRVERSGPNGEYVFEDVPTRTPNASVGAVTPNRIPAGSQSTQIIVTGSGFRPIGSTIPNQILFNGQPLPTSFDSSTQLRATIPSQFLRSAGFASVTVRILNSDNTTSVTPPLTIEIAGGSETAHPVIKSLNPPSCQVGTPGLQVTINGSNLLNGTTQVLWNGQPRGIISGSNTQLVFAPLPSDLARAGASKVQVTNAGGVSNEVTFTLADPGLVINSISPPSYTAPTSSVTVVPPLTLTINGSGFQSNSVVRANSSFLTTTFVSGSQLRAQLGSAFLNTQSNVVISVLNPSAGQISNFVNFPINQAAASTTGSVLLFPLYSSGASSASNHNTSISITNTNAQQGVVVGLYFVDGKTNIIGGPLFLNLNGAQTASFLTSDVDPGVSGYIIAVAARSNGCPAGFNFLRGSSATILPTGHSATLNAVAIRALSNPAPSCSTSSPFVALNFNGSVYERAPHQVVADNIPSPSDNNTLLILNSLGANLHFFSSASSLNPTTASSQSPFPAGGLGSIFGLLYDSDLSVYSFSTGTTASQLFRALDGGLPRTSPSFGSVITSGERGKMTLFPFSSTGPAIFGAVINRGPALNGGYLLRPLTLKAVSMTLPFGRPESFVPSSERAVAFASTLNSLTTGTVAGNTASAIVD